MKYKVELMQNGEVLDHALVEATNAQQITRKALEVSKAYRNLNYIDLRVLNENGDIWFISAHIQPTKTGKREAVIFRNSVKASLIDSVAAMQVFAGKMSIEDAITASRCTR
jgi:hypothetical protein